MIVYQSNWMLVGRGFNSRHLHHEVCLQVMDEIVGIDLAHPKTPTYFSMGMNWVRLLSEGMSAIRVAGVTRQLKLNVNDNEPVTALRLAA